jgi:hypothetical protein
MKKVNICFSLLILLAFFSISTYGQDTMAPREKWSLESAEGKVTAINKDTREITLKGADGDLFTITASDAVERFDEISVGDLVTFDYYTSMKAEFRAPTAEELEEPLVVLVDGVKAPEGMDPGAIIGAQVKAVVTIEILNRPSMIATVKGPRGNYTSIPMEDEELMTQLHIGQVVILTYTEAVAVTLEKVASK